MSTIFFYKSMVVILLVTIYCANDIGFCFLKILKINEIRNTNTYDNLRLTMINDLIYNFIILL